MSYVSFPIEAKFVWSLVFDYDNSGNEGQITRKYTFKESTKYTSKQFNQSVASKAQKLAEQGHIKLEAGVSYGPVSANMGIGYESSKEINDMLENTTEVQSESDITTEKEEQRTYTVGPRSRLCLYQRLFEGPGMTLFGQVTRTTPKPLGPSEHEQDTSIDLVLVPQTFAEKTITIKVIYTWLDTEAPIDRIQANNTYSDEINEGNWTGYLVWLVAETTTKVSEALTTVDTILTDKPDPKLTDLAAGGGTGKFPFRYLVPVRQHDKTSYITKLGLYRSYGSSPPDLSGFAGRHTRDLNEARDGGYLYLVWETQGAYPATTTTNE
ncbi:hypothetical protein H0H93_013681 [Arthromyces matolae]|nr:hypothetical protein H0H93_013681 [Arthromyces matolae]